MAVRVVGDGEKAPLCCTDVLFAILFVANLVPLCYLAVSFSEDIEVYQKDLKLLQLLNAGHFWYLPRFSVVVADPPAALV
jgi:hypothetical protein